MSLVRSDSVLVAKRLPVQLSSTRFGPLLAAGIHTPPEALSVPQSEPVIARSVLLSKCQPDKRSVANKIQDAEASQHRELEHIRSSLPQYLLERKCQCLLQNLTPAQIQTSRHSTRYYASGSQAGKRKRPGDHNSWLFNELTHCSSRLAGAKYSKFTHSTFGVHLCRSCFCHVYDISISKFDKARSTARDATVAQGSDVVLAESLRSLTTRDRLESVGRTTMRCFCDQLADECEAMPHQLEVGDEASATFDVNAESNMHHNETRYFPACYTFKSMYAEYCEHVSTLFSRTLKPFEYDHFRKTMKKLYPLCSALPKTSVLFKCITCAGLRAEFDGCTDERVKLACLHYMKAHKVRFKRSRQNYAQTIAYSLSNPAQLLSNIIDGMDQQKCCSPRIANCRADLPKNCQMKFHVIGSLVHGCKMFAFCLVSSKWAQAGPQLTVTVILKTLRRCVDLNGFLPQDYHLQLDNPSGENKNHDVLAFMSLLADWDVFTICTLEFGVTGHTHLDIDQAFSRLSVSLSLGHLTVADFFERVGAGFTHCGAPTEAISCNELVNWHLASSPLVHEFSGVSRPLLFKFSKDICGKVVVHYKSHCDKQQWKGGDQVFKVPMPMSTSSAYDWPFVPVDSTLLLSNMAKLSPYVPAGQRAHMLSSWAAFAAAEDSAAASMCKACMSLRSASKAADSAVYQLEKVLRKSYTALSGQDVPSTQKTQLAKLRVEKRTARSACDSHVSGCHGNENSDFAWLKAFAGAPVELRRPKQRHAPGASGGPECPLPEATHGTSSCNDERLLRITEKYEVASSDDDDCSMFGHKGAHKGASASALHDTHELGGCDIKRGQYLAILLECVPGEKGTAEWGVVRVVDGPNAASNEVFKASVLDCVANGVVVESGGVASSNNKRWLLRRGGVARYVAATYFPDPLLQKYVADTCFFDFLLQKVSSRYLLFVLFAATTTNNGSQMLLSALMSALCCAT